MKFTNVIASFLLGSASATINVEINNQAIERVTGEAQQFEAHLQHSQQELNVTAAINDAQIKASIDMWNSQQEILRPAVNALDMYLKLYSPGSNCDSTTFSQCLINGQISHNGTPAPPQAFLWNQCSTESGCITKWADISYEKKLKLEQKFGKTS